MRLLCIFALSLLSFSVFGQKKMTVKKPVKKVVQKKTVPKVDLTKINDSIPDLIPKRVDGKLGFVNQRSKFIIAPEYSFGTFFYEDCNLQNSPDEKVRRYGSAEYASVTVNHNDYRIDKTGKKVYTFKKEDLGTCSKTYREQPIKAYVSQGFYGIIDEKNFNNPTDYRQFLIYPQYQYLFVMESENAENPMIIASVNDAFGVIDKYNRVIIPFEYADIKRNFSWKMANMFEVSRDGKNYFFIDEKNKSY